MCLLVFIFGLGFGAKASAATYYVTQSGTGAKDGSISAPSAIATFNAGTAPYNNLAGNTVYLMGIFTTAITIPVGGTVGNVATIRGDYPGNTAIIANTASYKSLEINGMNYITLSGFSIAPSHSVDYATGLNIDGATTGITISNIAIDMSLATGAHSYGLINTGAATSLSISNVSIAGAKNNGVYLYGAGTTGLSLSYVTVIGSQYPFSFTGTVGLTVDHSSASNSSTTDTSGHGFYIHNVSNATFTSNTATNNNGSGFSIGDVAHDITLTGNTASGNANGFGVVIN